MSWLHLPAGTLVAPPWELELTAEAAGWSWTSLRVLRLGAGGSHSFPTGGEEMLVVPLAGGCTVTCGDRTAALGGRHDVFSGPTDVAYLPCRHEATISSDGGGRFAVAGAAADTVFPFRHRPAPEVSIELRGTGSCSRRIALYGMPGDLDAQRLMVSETLTPSGNWSSYPPHKHDETRDGEAETEEIYYFEIARGGMAYQRLYGTPDRPVDLLAEVRSGDVVLVPHGYHGPSMAAPGYDLSYLNVMAGPGRRVWLPADDPAHAWVRDTWEDQEVDPRLLDA
jgi:5-deoxy-glucuronate isomerase